MPPYRLAIFDFDGTLADSLGWMRSVFGEFAERYSFKRCTSDELEALRSLDSRAILAHLGIPAWRLPFIAADVRQRVAQEAERISLFPGAQEALTRIHQAGIALALVSSNGEAVARRILGPELSALFGHYACSASFFGKHSKFRRALKWAGVRPDQAIAIGDEVRDLEAATKAGIASAAVTWGYARSDALRSRSPTAIFSTFEELVRALA